MKVKTGKVLNLELMLFSVAILSLYYVVLTIEILSFFNKLDEQYLRYSFYFLISVIVVINIIIAIRLRSLNKIYGNKFFSKYIFIITISFSLSFAKGILISPNVYDAMTYHLPRIFYWLNQGNLDFFYTSNTRQNEVPPLASYLYLYIFSLTSTDRYLFLLSFLSILVISILIYLIVVNITKNSRIGYISSIVFLFSPTVVGFSSDVYVDSFSTLLVFLLFYFYTLFSNQKQVVYFYFSWLLLPLLLLAKSNALILSLVIYVFLIYQARKGLKILIPKTFLIVLISSLAAVPFFLRLLDSKLTSIGSVIATEPNFIGGVLNALKMFFTMLQTPIPIINEFMMRIFQYFSGKFNRESLGGNYEYYGEFFLSSDIGIDAVGNPLLLILSLSAITFLLIKKQYLDFSYIFLIQLFTLLTFFIWQPWISRFSMPLLALGSVLFGLALYRFKQTMGWNNFFPNTIVLVAILYGSFWLLYQPGRSLMDPAPLYSVASRLGVETAEIGGLRHDITLDRREQYFAFNQKVQKSYLESINFLRDKGISKIYLVNSGDDLEHPLLALTDYAVQVRHLDLNNASEDLKSGDVIFCTIQCQVIDSRKIYQTESVTLYEKS